MIVARCRDDAFMRRPITEADIEAEIQRYRH
jgi:hypothetical protein